jgi:NitT/TauT family transport system substrate-binding protein
MSRRAFLQQASALGAASLLGFPGKTAAEPLPEVRKIRLIHAPSICLAPQLLARDLMLLEGFSEVEYVDIKVNKLSTEIIAGRADISMVATPELVPVIDTSDSLVVIGGIHAGCYELFGGPGIRHINDIKGKKIAISAVGSPEHTYIASIAAYVGMNPNRDLQWVLGDSSADAMRLFVEGQADGFLAFPPQPQELRMKRVGNLILDTSTDRPWSQYFCCMVAGNRDFVRNHPVAAKRALRAMLKAADICAAEPERAARYLVENDYEQRYAVGLDVLKSLSYRRWRDANPEDTIRFHALRLYEAGIIKVSPEKLIEKGTDWRFFNELKKELKA